MTGWSKTAFTALRERESWDEERYEVTRYELAEMTVVAENSEAQIHALGEQIADLRAVLAEANRVRDEVAGALRVTNEHNEALEAQLARTREALQAAEQAEAIEAARAEAERDRAEELVAEAAERERAIEHTGGEMAELRVALAQERAVREAAELRDEEMTERVVSELVAVRKAVEGGKGGGRART